MEDVAVLITGTDGSTLAMRLTDRSGKILPLALEVPDASESRVPGNQQPYRTVNIYARKENYEQIEAMQVQIFADTVTLQNLEMIPLAELPAKWSASELFETPAQNL